MQRRAAKLLDDIRDAAEAIQVYTAGKTEAEYLADRMLRDAVERRFEIVGEAMRRLRALDPALAARIRESERVVQFRNVLAHGYDAIEDQRVWEIVAAAVPILLSDVRKLLEEYSAR